MLRPVEVQESSGAVGQYGSGAVWQYGSMAVWQYGSMAVGQWSSRASGQQESRRMGLFESGTVGGILCGVGLDDGACKELFNGRSTRPRAAYTRAPVQRYGRSGFCELPKDWSVRKKQGYQTFFVGASCK